MNWMLTGGAGYIGAHVARALVAAGDDVVVLDDLSTGAAERVTPLPLVRADLTDGPEPLVEAMRAHGVTGVVHLAAKKSVPESVEMPVHYYEQNVGGTAVLLRAAVAARVRHVLYSSTAAVYGAPAGLVDETCPTAPVNPYGESKLAAEWLVRATAAAHGMTWAALRYFNVAGAADPLLADRGRTNLLPIALDAVERDEPVKIFGGDWPTPDGTCIRDYVHVEDLAEAHVAMARSLRAGLVRSGTYNVGRGEGVSVMQMVDAVRRVTGRPVRHRVVDRRPGDPAQVVADPSAIAAAAGWRATRDVDDIVRSAWQARACAPGR